MLDILPGYYIVFLALGLAAIVVVLFYSFTRNSNYEVQQRAKKIQQRREKEKQVKSRMSTKTAIKPDAYIISAPLEKL